MSYTFTNNALKHKLDIIWLKLQTTAENLQTNAEFVYHFFLMTNRISKIIYFFLVWKSFTAINVKTILIAFSKIDVVHDSYRENFACKSI